MLAALTEPINDVTTSNSNQSTSRAEPSRANGRPIEEPAEDGPARREGTSVELHGENTSTKSQNVTLFTRISPAQALAVAALVKGASVTKAALEAGVTRETVSRWVHQNPVFIAELQNARAEIAAQTRCALEALGEQAIATLADALRNNFMLPTRLRAACAVLKLIGADRAETMPPTTAEEVHLRLQQRAEELRKGQSDLDASQAIESRCIDVTGDPARSLAANSSSEARPEEEEVQSTGGCESKPGGMAEAGPGAGGENLVDQWRSYLKDVANHLDEPGRVADRATAGMAGLDGQGGADGSVLTSLLHRAMSRVERPAPPLPAAPPRQGKQARREPSYSDRGASR